MTQENTLGRAARCRHMAAWPALVLARCSGAPRYTPCPRAPDTQIEFSANWQPNQLRPPANRHVVLHGKAPPIPGQRETYRCASLPVIAVSRSPPSRDLHTRAARGDLDTHARFFGGVQASRRMIWPAFTQAKARVMLQVQQGVHWSAALAKEELSLSRPPVGYAASLGCSELRVP